MDLPKYVSKHRLYMAIAAILSLTLYFWQGMLFDFNTTTYRLSHTSFGLVAIIPLSVISLGCFIIITALRERKKQNPSITKKLYVIGITIIVLGFSFFGFAALD